MTLRGITRLRGWTFLQGVDIKAITVPGTPALGSLPHSPECSTNYTVFFCPDCLSPGTLSSTILTIRPPLSFLCKPPSSLLSAAPGGISPILFYNPIALGSPCSKPLRIILQISYLLMCLSQGDVRGSCGRDSILLLFTPYGQHSAWHQEGPILSSHAPISAHVHSITSVATDALHPPV